MILRFKRRYYTLIHINNHILYIKLLILVHFYIKISIKLIFLDKKDLI